MLSGEAPLNEVLAAGILQLTEWDRRSPLADFMCGSGTLPIEAALLARNIAPGTIRQKFGYMRWPDFDAALHAELMAEAKRAALPRLEFPIVGSDLDPTAIAAARENARRAGVQKDVQFEVAHYEAARPPAPGGTLVTNPPYDERMKVSQAAAVYRRIGDALKRDVARLHGIRVHGQRRSGEIVRSAALQKIPPEQRADPLPVAAIRGLRRDGDHGRRRTTKDTKEAKEDRRRDEEQVTTDHADDTDDIVEDDGRCSCGRR